MSAALEIENEALRVRIDPRALRVDVRDRSGALVLEGLRPAVAGEGGVALASGEARVHAIGEVRGVSGAATRVEMQSWERGGIGWRWTLELPRDGPGVAASLCLENRGDQAVGLQALYPLAIEAAKAARIGLAGPVAAVRLPLTGNPRGGEPLESLLLLELGGDRWGLFGFITARLAFGRWTLKMMDSEATAFEAVNALGNRTLAPGDLVESDRAWLAVGRERGALLIDWARRIGLEMDARAPRRGAASWSSTPGSNRLQGLSPDDVHEIEVQEADDVPSYRARLIQVRRQLGAGTLLLASAAPFGASIGLVDAHGGDRRAPPGPQDLAFAFTNQRLWLLAPGPLWVAEGSLEEARTRASIAALAGGLLTLADDIDGLCEERLAILERILPPLAREADAPSTEGILVTPLIGGRLAVLLLNSGAERAELGLSFRLLQRRGPFHGFDFWNNEPLGMLHQGIPPRSVDPGGCRVVGLTPPADRVQVVGSSLHIGMGTLEVASLRSLPGSGHALSLRLPGTHRGDVWIAEPESTTARRVAVDFSDAARLEIRPSG